MIRCPNCNRELEDGARFCDECGTKIETVPQMVPVAEPNQMAAYVAENAGGDAGENTVGGNMGTAPASAPEAVFCPNCGTKTTTEFEFCPNCGANILTGAVGAQQTEEKPKKGIKGLVIGIVAACVVLVAVVAVFAGGLVGGKSGSGKLDYMTYVKDKEIFYSNLGKNKSIQITDRFLGGSDIENSSLQWQGSTIGRYIVKSADGKKLFFPDRLDDSISKGFTLYYKKLSKLQGDAQKIDSSVDGYIVNDNATTLIYLKNSDTLYLYNVSKGDKEKIAGDVTNVQVAEDCKTLYYVNDDKTLYLWKSGKDKTKIDSDVTRVNYISDDFKTIYYTKDDALYKKVGDKDKEKIASDVESVVKVYDSGEIYYYKEGDEEFSYKDLVDDDFAEQDEKQKEVDYPWRYNYDSESKYNKAMDEYNAYQEKVSRDWARENLEYTISTQALRELYYYDGKDSELISSAVISGSSIRNASDEPVVLYFTLERDRIDKIKFSKILDMESSESSEELLKRLTAGVTINIAAKDKANVFDYEIDDQDDLDSFRIDSEGKRFLFLADVNKEKDRAGLYVGNIKNGKPSEAELYDDDVSADAGVSFAGSHVIYYKDYKNYEGDLYIDRKEVDNEVSTNRSYDSDSDSVYYLMDYDSDDSEGTLKVYKSGKSQKIAEDVYSYRLLDNGKIGYLCDYSQRSYKGDLYLYSGNKSTKVDEDVVAISLGAVSRKYQGGLNYYGW